VSRGRVDGVDAVPRRRDAVDAAVRESPHLASERCRDGVDAVDAREPR